MIDLAVLFVGGANVGRFGVEPVTLDALLASAAIDLLAPARVIPVHHTDWAHFVDPLTALEDRLAAGGRSRPPARARARRADRRCRSLHGERVEASGRGLAGLDAAERRQPRVLGLDRVAGGGVPRDPLVDRDPERLAAGARSPGARRSRRPRARRRAARSPATATCGVVVSGTTSVAVAGLQVRVVRPEEPHHVGRPARPAARSASASRICASAPSTSTGTASDGHRATTSLRRCVEVGGDLLGCQRPEQVQEVADEVGAARRRARARPTWPAGQRGIRRTTGGEVPGSSSRPACRAASRNGISYMWVAWQASHQRR